MGDRFHLRWFTSVCEVELCGHATLASAHVLFRELNQPGDTLHFDTRSGELSVKRNGNRLALDFPSRPPGNVDVPPELISALGAAPAEVLGARDYLVRYNSADQVHSLRLIWKL